MAVTVWGMGMLSSCICVCVCSERYSHRATGSVRNGLDILPHSFLLSSKLTYCMYYSGSASRRAGSDGSMSASGSAGPGFDPRRGSKFSLENFEPRG